MSNQTPSSDGDIDEQSTTPSQTKPQNEASKFKVDSRGMRSGVPTKGKQQSQEKSEEINKPKRDLFDGIVIESTPEDDNTYSKSAPKSLRNCETSEQMVKLTDQKLADQTTDNIRNQIGETVRTIFQESIK